MLWKSGKRFFAVHLRNVKTDCLELGLFVDFDFPARRFINDPVFVIRRGAPGCQPPGGESEGFRGKRNRKIPGRDLFGNSSGRNSGRDVIAVRCDSVWTKTKYHIWFYFFGQEQGFGKKHFLIFPNCRLGNSKCTGA